MFSTALLCGIVLWVAPAVAADAGEPAVTVREIFDVRHARPGAEEDASEPRFTSDRPGMRLVLEVRGAAVADASHYGMLELESAADNQGDKLKLDKNGFGFHDMRKEFVAIDREQMFFGEDEPPTDAIRIEVPFTSPPRAATAVSLRGKLQLKKVQTVAVLVPTTLGDVQDEQLAKLGLKLKIVKPEAGNGLAYDASGKLDALHKVEIVDASGKALETSGRMSYGDDESQHCEITLAEAPPADAKVKLSLVVKAENVPVTFELKDVKLP